MSVGAGQTSYGFTNEYQDSYIKLIYLRSRFYSPEVGRFQTRDSWQGDYNRPGSLNKWNYVEGNPVNRVDPTGQYSEEDFGLSFTHGQGTWQTLDRQAALLAVIDVGLSFSPNSPASAFKDVYGITDQKLMEFKWDEKCIGCKPLQCQAKNNIEGKNGNGQDYWTDDYEYIYKKGEKIVKVDDSGNPVYIQIDIPGGGKENCNC